MKKVIYIIKAGVYRHSIMCHSYCNTCVIRFRCYTNKGKRLEVTEEELILCREEGSLYSAGP